jgi:hypothetical protein
MGVLGMKSRHLLLAGATLLPCPDLMAQTFEECLTVGRAHEALLEDSFEVERTFRLSVNGNLKNREVARLTYSSGKLETEVVEYEAFSKTWVHENEGKDFVLEIGFACERLEAVGEGRYELTSEDGLEVAEFELGDESGALRPVTWRTDETARLLFKKFAIAARAEYSDFEWK